MFLLNILLAPVWVALTGYFTPANFAFGFVLGYLMLWLAQRAWGPPIYFTKVRQLFSFIVFFLWEMVQANPQVAYFVLTSHRKMRPGVIALPLDARTDAEITLLSNLIALTPGTLSLDVSADGRVLYIHTMYFGDEPDQSRRKIKEGFERPVLEMTR